MKDNLEGTALIQDELEPMMRRDPEGGNGTIPRPTNQENNRDQNKEEIFGDIRTENVDFDTIRISTLNINTMPINIKHTRTDFFRDWVLGSKANIISLPEHNRDYSFIHADKHPDNLMFGWWDDSKVITAWMQKHNELREQRQHGGVSMVINNRLVSSIRKSGTDPEKMGRWAWTTVHGKQDYKTTIISLYFPIKNTRYEKSVYNQQATALDKKYPGQQKEPHRQYVQDLKKFIDGKIEQGHNIIVAGDFNQNIQRWDAPLVKMLRQLGLKELIADKHNGALPPTHVNGSHAIDGIWGSNVFHAASAGYLPFGDNKLSPHRECWVDIPIEQILGGQGEAITRPKARRLRTEIPKIEEKYNAIVDDEIKARKLDEKLQNLQNEVQQNGNNATASQQRQFNNLHEQQRRCIAKGDKRCVKIRRGEVPFSPEINKVIGEIVCWKLLIKREARKGKKNRPHARTVKRLLHRWKFSVQWKHKSIVELREALTASKLRYRKLRPHAQSKREEFFSQLAFDRAMMKGGKMESHLKQILHRAGTNKMWRQVKSMTKKQTGGAASYVEILNEDGTRTRVTEQGPMEQHIKEANEAKLLQAHGKTPLTSEPLQSYYGEQGDTERWKLIHRGEVPIPEEIEVEEGFRLFMEAITKDHLPKVNMILDDEFYNKSWKKMREKTSSAPPTHFGHYRAPPPDTPSSIVNTIIGTLPFQAGFVPELWKECTNTMLIKKINDMRPEKLRLITLLEPQYLQGSKISNKVMMDNAEKHHALAAEQYGSRKRKNSRTHCLNKRLVYDLSRIMHLTMLLMANDLKSCYDRILMLIAFLLLTHYGIDEKSAIVLTKCMMEMRHRIRTIFGDSEFYYGGDKWKNGVKPHGNGQGNGNGPGLWAGISSICLDILRNQGYGMNMISPVTSTSINLAGFAFVDDTDLIQDGETINEVITKSQQGLVLWEQLMSATGGALEPSKSDWVLIDYQYKNGKWKLGPKQDQLKLEVRGPSGEIEALTQLDPKDARETLGIWQSPTGDDEIQFEKLKEAIMQWCTGMESRFLPSNYIETAIRCTIGRKIHYCLVATCFTKKQCDELIDPIVRRIMPRMKIARNTKRDVVYAPTTLLGIGIDHPFIVQLIEHIKELSNVGGTQKHTGRILTDVIEHHMLEVGHGGQITEWDISIIAELMTQTWMKSTLIDMNTYDIRVQSDHEELNLWRQRDSFIIEEAIKRTGAIGGYNLETIKSINNCRKFLRATTISDITNGNGTEIVKAAYDCKFPLHCTSSIAYDWPIQAKPGTNDIIRWKNFLQNLTRRGRQLTVSLGKWLQSAASHHDWRYQSEHDRLYERSNNGWKIWTIDRSSRNSTRRKKYKQSRIVATEMEVQQSSIPIVYKTSPHDNYIRIDGYNDILLENPTTNTSLSEELRSYGWIISDITILDEPSIISMIRQGTAKGASDGSCSNKKSTSAFSIFNDCIDLMEGGNFIPGNPKDQNSYRSELGGLLGLVLSVFVLCKRNGITNGAITVGCDNDSALEKMFDEDEIQCTMPSYDLIRLIRFYMKKTPITWKKQKITGHQDKTKKYEQLDEWGKANVRVDKSAKKFMEKHPEIINGTYPTGRGWTVYIGDEPILSNLSKRLYSHCTEKNIKRYWAEKNYIDLDVYDDSRIANEINWEAISLFSTMVPSFKRRWITKHMAHISATNHVMGPNMRKERDTDICPMCDEVEHATHVLLCTSELTTTTFNRGLSEMRKWLEQHCEWDMTDAILENVRAIRQRRNININQTWSDQVKQAIQAQDEMSLVAFTSGLIHKKWCEAQAPYLIETESKMTPDVWCAHIVRLMWDITFDIWTKRCDYLHNTEEARKKILAANVDNDIDNLISTMPSSTWMTPSQKGVLLQSKHVIKGWKSKRKIRWLRRATILKKAYETHLQHLQGSQSAQLMRTYVNYQGPIRRNLTRQPYPNTTYQQQRLTEFTQQRNMPHTMNLAQINSTAYTDTPYFDTSKQMPISMWLQGQVD